MHHTAKAGLLLLAGLAACQPLSPYASLGGKPLTPLNANSALFRNPEGQFYMRLPYIEIRDLEDWPPCTFLSCVWLGDQALDLAQVVDVPSFRPVPGTHNYWVDKCYFYAGPYLDQPGQTPFFILGRVGTVNFLSDPDSTYVHGTYYY